MGERGREREEEKEGRKEGRRERKRDGDIERDRHLLTHSLSGGNGQLCTRRRPGAKELQLGLP